MTHFKNGVSRDTRRSLGVLEVVGHALKPRLLQGGDVITVSPVWLPAPRARPLMIRHCKA